MINIAVVEDDDEEFAVLAECLERYGRTAKDTLTYKRYIDAESFLAESNLYDMVFLDIMLPNQTGMDAAAQLRKKNDKIVIIFVTTMAQFAIKGYEVNALDYIIKPVAYDRFTLKMHKAFDIILSNRAQPIVINDAHGMVQMETDRVYYVEVAGHKLTWHTDSGTYNEYGSLGSLEKMLKAQNFMRCNACYLVNPKYIARVNNIELVVVLTNGETLKISQPKRKSFIAELTNWLGQGRC